MAVAVFMWATHGDLKPGKMARLDMTIAMATQKKSKRGRKCDTPCI